VIERREGIRREYSTYQKYDKYSSPTPQQQAGIQDRSQGKELSVP
jgi:hypothetical protein